MVLSRAGLCRRRRNARVARTQGAFVVVDDGRDRGRGEAERCIPATARDCAGEDHHNPPLAFARLETSRRPARRTKFATTLDPPYETNGSVIPVSGIRRSTPPTM